MPKIFEYFGFVFFFYSNEHEPIHVHVTHKGCQSIFELIMDNGILTEIRMREKAGEEPPKPDGGRIVPLFRNGKDRKQ